MMKKRIRIGTRKSKLALAQTYIVKEKMEKLFPDIQVEIAEMSTKGDELLNRSLTSFGGKGVFTQELEEALLHGDIDLAVHSAKDMPMEFPEGLGIGAALCRAAVADVIVTRDGTLLKDMAPGSIVGTSSLRRELQVKEINPLVEFRMIRGNIHTRLRKLAEGQYDAIVLAAAGLERMELQKEGQFSFEYMNPVSFLPAAGQAILGVESRNGDLREILDAIGEQEALVCLKAERAFLAAIGGSCNAPAAAYARLYGTKLVMNVMFAPDQIHMKKISGECECGMDVQKAEAFGREMAGRVRQGKVWLVGAGPGNMDLVTLGCLDCIRRADVVVYDSLATDALLNEARLDAELIYAGKRADHHHLKQGETNALLIEKAKEGKNVVRLKGGDPFVFGRGGEEAQELTEAGIEFEILSGVSSCYAAPGSAGIPVTHRDFASSFHVITGHEGSHKTENVLDYATLAKEEGTLVFLMGLKNLPNIAKNLIENGKDPETMAAVVQEGTTAHQKVAIGTLENIAETAKREGIQTPAITIVGDVVSLQREIFGQKKGRLSGKRVLITATEKMAARQCQLYRQEGAEVIPFSLIHTKPLMSEGVADTMNRIEQFTWIIFTSGNGVDLFFDGLIQCKKDIRSLANLKFAVIGDGTREALLRHGIQADFVPKKYSSRDMAKEWVPILKKTDKVLMMRAREASSELNRALEAAGIEFSDVALYRSAVDYRKEEELRRILKDTDYVTLCSASAVRAYAAMTNNLEYDAKIICIGPVTAEAARKAGLTVYQTAVTYTAEGMRDVLLYDVGRE